jgi:hypothetical protein
MESVDEILVHKWEVEVRLFTGFFVWEIEELKCD